MRGLVRAIAAGVLLAAAAPAAATDYVPDTGWSDEGGAEFYERWFGHQLEAMGERPFSDPAVLQDALQSFRLTVLPSFEPAYAIRVDRRADQSYDLYWVVLDGAGGYAPGKIARKGSRRLNGREIRKLGSAINDAHLETQSMQEPPPPHGRDPKTGDEFLTVCADGTAFVFELVSKDRRSFVERTFCGDSDEKLSELIDRAVRLLPVRAAGRTKS